MKKKLTKEDFIEKARLVHGDKYNYSLVEYLNSKTKVKIICEKHNIFEQIPYAHLKGFGCAKCGSEAMGNKRKLNNTTFIEKSKIVHGNKYDYSLVVYENDKTKINIICKKHGVFKQSAGGHLQGIGCQKCGIENSIKIRSSNNKDFIKNAKIVHGNKYDYSLVDYINSKVKIKIICIKHGVFLQTPYEHLAGRGCPACKESNGESIIRQILLDNNINFISQKKFNDCVGIRNKLPFDFYIIDKNILIEFNGRQHYKAIDLFGGDIGYKKLNKTDQLKKEYCELNNIKLLVITYKKINNIKEILINERII